MCPSSKNIPTKVLPFPPATPRFPTHPRARRKAGSGSILVAVLGFLLLLSFVTLAFLEEAVEKIRYFGLFYNRQDMRVVAYSALETSLAVINQVGEIDGKLHGPAQGWGQPLETAALPLPPGYTAQIQFSDESARFPLAKADRALLRAFFEVIEIPFDQQDALIDALIDWTDADDLASLSGFDGEDYETRDPPMRPANQRLQGWDELLLIEGWKDAFLDEAGQPLPRLARFTNAFSLYNDGPININGAPSEVLETLALLYGLDVEGLRFFQAGQDGESGNADDRLLLDNQRALIPPEAEAQGIAYTSTLIKIDITVRYGEASFLLSALVSWKGGANPGARSDGETPNASRSGAPRGSTVQARDRAASLGYPFNIIRLSENSRF